MHPISFNKCDSFFKKTLQAVDDYCSWSGKKVTVINDKNEAIIQKRNPNFFKTLAVVISYATLIIPIIMYGLQTFLHHHYKANILSFSSKDLTPDQKEAIFPFNPMKKVWAEFGYPEEALRDHPAAALFLKNSNLMFMARAYLEMQIQFDEDYHPLIKSSGVYQRVGDLQEIHQFKLHNNGMTTDIFDQEGKEWNFVHDHGLIQTDWKFKKELPSFKLSPDQLIQLQECGKKQDPDETKTCFVQVYTSQRPLVPDNELTKNFKDQTPTHVGLRLIKSDGTGYSIGYESRIMGKENFRNFPFTFLTTIPAKPSIRDYDEFYEYNSRLVTTIPIDPAKLDSLLDNIQSISNESDCRFNHLKMNCLAFSSIALAEAGVTENFEDYLASILFKALPDLEAIPVVGIPLAKINQGFKWAVNLIPTNVLNVLNYIPSKINTLFCNLFLLTLGLNKKSKEIPDQNENMAPGNWAKLSQLNRGTSWSKLFDKEATRIYWPPAIIAWQRQQASTQNFKYEKGHPQFNIVGGQSC